MKDIIQNDLDEMLHQNTSENYKRIQKHDENHT